MRFFSNLKSSLSKTSSKLSQGIKSVFTKRKLDQETLDDLLDTLIAHDLGVSVSTRIVDEVRSQKFEQDVDIDAIKAIMATTITSILEPYASHKLFDGEFPVMDGAKKPYTIVMLGVNGTGKTTTMAKLAHHFQQNQRRVSFAAADTFRAAAVEQLAVWADRLSIPLHRGAEGADPASVAYQGYHHAQSADILMVDTAGRLHNKNDLMDELTKIYRVLKKADDHAPHEVIMVLDATVGQNALMHVASFLKAVPITGLIITKLDGTARGGIVVALAEQYKIPIYAIGVGEGMNDLAPFDASEFAKNLVGFNS